MSKRQFFSAALHFSCVFASIQALNSEVECQVYSSSDYTYKSRKTCNASTCFFSQDLGPGGGSYPLIAAGCLTERNVPSSILVFDMQWCSDRNLKLNSFSDISKSYSYCYTCNTSHCNTEQKVRFDEIPRPPPRETPLECYKCNSTSVKDCMKETEICPKDIYTCYSIYNLTTKLFLQGCRTLDLFSDRQCDDEYDRKSMCYMCTGRDENDMCNYDIFEPSAATITTTDSTTTTSLSKEENSTEETFDLTKFKTAAPAKIWGRCYSCKGEEQCKNKKLWSEVSCKEHQSCFSITYQTNGNEFSWGITRIKEKGCTASRDACEKAHGTHCFICSAHLCNNREDDDADQRKQPDHQTHRADQRKQTDNKSNHQIRSESSWKLLMATFVFIVLI